LLKIFFITKKSNKMNPFLTEFLGTMMLILLGNGVVANVVLNQTKGNNSGWIVITFGWAMAVFVAGNTFGGDLNPAVTIAKLIKDSTDFNGSLLKIVGQIFGAMTGATLVWLIYKDHYEKTDDEAAKLATFATAPAIRNTVSNCISEFIGTFVLMIAILRFSSGDATLGAVNALPIALTVLAIGLCLGGTTGYAINPARDLGPRLMHMILPMSKKGRSDWDYAWIPVVAPIFGAIAAVLLNNLIGR
jgi:glycerol uptake facilitator protein